MGWFLAVLLIFCNCLARLSRTRDSQLLCLAMAATVVADFHMLITGNILLGIYAFCCVQLIYCLRYAGAWLCGILLLVWAALAPISVRLASIEAAGLRYAVGFVFSLFAVASKKYPCPYGRLATWGMALFACCDILVAAEYFFPGVGYPLMWAFYLPAQLLLSFSGLPELTAGSIKEDEVYEDSRIR